MRRHFLVVAALTACLVGNTAAAQVTPAAVEANPPAASDAVKAVAAQQLLAERADWSDRRTDVVLPTLLTLGGVLFLAVGIPSMINGLDPENKKQESVYLGAVFAGVGAAALVPAVILFTTRTSVREKERRLDRIDGQLRSLGVTVSFAPWLTPPLGPTASLAGGLDLCVTL